MSLPQGRLCWLTLLAWAWGISVAWAQPAGIQDGAKLFSAEAIRKANEQIADLQKIHRIPLSIETVAGLSSEQQREYDKLKKAIDREHFRTELAEKRARELGADGVYVWVSKKPVQTVVVVGAEVPEDKLTPRARKELRDRLLKLKLDRHADAELLGVVEQVRRSADDASQPAVWPWVLGLIGAVLAVWVVIGLLRQREQTPEDVGQAPGGTIGMPGVHPAFLGKKTPSGHDLPVTPPPSAPAEEQEDPDSDLHARSDGR
jgi:hypothetical protein